MMATTDELIVPAGMNVLTVWAKSKDGVWMPAASLLLEFDKDVFQKAGAIQIGFEAYDPSLSPASKVL